MSSRNPSVPIILPPRISAPSFSSNSWSGPREDHQQELYRNMMALLLVPTASFRDRYASSTFDVDLLFAIVLSLHVPMAARGHTVSLDGGSYILLV